MTPWERFAAGNNEIIPIRVIDFDSDLIAEYLTPACPDSRNPSENTRIMNNSPGRKSHWLTKP